MKWLFGRTALWLWVTVLLAAVAFPAGQQQDLPEGQRGPSDEQTKQLVQMSCTACHGMDLIEAKRLDKKGWTDVVEGMISLGAQLKEAEIPIVVDYLTKNFGTAGADSAGPGPADAETKKLFETVCTTCHGMDLITSQPRDKDGWAVVVQSMVDLGAEVTPAQIPVLVDYLAKTYGSGGE